MMFNNLRRTNVSYTDDTYNKNTQKMELCDIKLHAGAVMGKTDKQVNVTRRMYRTVLNFTIAKIKYLKGYSIIN